MDKRETLVLLWAYGNSKGRIVRKADYFLLAKLVRALIFDRVNGSPNDQIAGSVKLLALTFAARASVDRAEFLKACGIE